MRNLLPQSMLVSCLVTLVGLATVRAQTINESPVYARFDLAPIDYKIHNSEWQQAAQATAEISESATTTLRDAQKPSVLQQATRPANALSAGKAISGAEGARSIIKYAPLLNFGYERVLQNNHSVYVGLSIYALGAGYSALGLKGEYRFYGLIKSSPKQAPEGFWVAPTAQIWRLSVNDTYYSGRSSLHVLHVGGMAGYQWLFNNRIALEPALGLAVGVVGSNASYGLAAGVLPLVALRVGYVLD